MMSIMRVGFRHWALYNIVRFLRAAMLVRAQAECVHMEARWTWEAETPNPGDADGSSRPSVRR